MAELFTEEDVRRYRLRVAMAIAGADVADYIDVAFVGGIADAAVPAILSALAEDGRLLRPRGDRRVHWGVRDREGVKPVGAGSGSEVLARIAADSGDGVLVWQTRTVWPNGEIHWGPWESVDTQPPVRYPISDGGPDHCGLCGQQVCTCASGGALPSDAPALEGFEAQWTVRRDGVIYSPQSEREAREYAAKYRFYELMRRFVGPWEPVTDPVSVLEEETRDDPRTS